MADKDGGGRTISDEGGRDHSNEGGRDWGQEGGGETPATPSGHNQRFILITRRRR